MLSLKPEFKMWRIFHQPIGTFVYFFFVRCENFALYRNKRLLRAVVALLQKNLLMLLAVRISSYGCTWEVWRALKNVEVLSCRHAHTHAYTRYEY